MNIRSRNITEMQRVVKFHVTLLLKNFKSSGIISNILWNLVNNVYTCQNKLIHFEKTKFLVFNVTLLGAYLGV